MSALTRRESRRTLLGLAGCAAGVAWAFGALLTLQGTLGAVVALAPIPVVSIATIAWLSRKAYPHEE